MPALVLAFPGRPSLIQAWGAALSLIGALALTLWQYAVILAPAGGDIVPQSALQGALANDGIAFFTRLTVYLTALLVIPIGYGYLQERRINRAEVEPLLLLSVVGMVALGTANDLITLFVSLEVLSLALYVLAGLARRDRRSQEASLKYFVLGAVASAILLYGMALVYVATGTLDLPGIGAAIGLVTTERTVAALGLGLVTVGIGFKVALAPFHLWTPDVYQGSPTNVTAFMAAATKAAGFAAALRLYLVAFPDLQHVTGALDSAAALRSQPRRDRRGFGGGGRRRPPEPESLDPGVARRSRWQGGRPQRQDPGRVRQAVQDRAGLGVPHRAGAGTRPARRTPRSRRA
jgi:NADH-quinone oxidoreductase subunit N